MTLKFKNFFYWRALLLPMVLIFPNCTKTNFGSDGSVARKSNSKSKVGNPEDGGNLGLPPGSLLSDQRKVEATDVHRIWTVTSGGIATQFSVEGDKVTTKIWTGLTGSGGARTYVTEAGFVVARYPYLYFIDPENTPQGPLPADSKKDIGAGNRICVASYLKNNKRYLFAAFESGKYWDIPMADEKPYKPLWNDPSVIKGSIPKTSQWGYSCFIDQKRNIFYSQNFSTPAAINLNTLIAHTTGAPNHSFDSDDSVVKPLVESTRSTVKSASYAMAGDPDGNVYNATDVYTMAYDSSSDSVWVSKSNVVNNIGIFPRDCLTKQKTCSGYLNFVNARVGAYLGPMSALRDGRIVATTRDPLGSVYILSLKDKSDRTKGFDQKLIGVAGGDPYMYTDFTGASLYLRESVQAFEISKLPEYKSGMPNKNTLFNWKSKSGAGKPWKDIKLEARCYSDPAQKPGFEEVKTVGVSDKFTPFVVQSCQDKVTKFVEVQLTQLQSSLSLIDVEFIQVAIKQ